MDKVGQFKYGGVYKASNFHDKKNVGFITEVKLLTMIWGVSDRKSPSRFGATTQAVNRDGDHP